MIEFVCPNCQTLLKIPDQYAGVSGKCNHCNCRITIPARGSSAQRGNSHGANIPPVSSDITPQHSEILEVCVMLTMILHGETPDNTNVLHNGPINALADAFNCMLNTEYPRTTVFFSVVGLSQKHRAMRSLDADLTKPMRRLCEIVGPEAAERFIKTLVPRLRQEMKIGREDIEAIGDLYQSLFEACKKTPIGKESQNETPAKGGPELTPCHLDAFENVVVLTMPLLMPLMRYEHKKLRGNAAFEANREVHRKALEHVALASLYGLNAGLGTQYSGQKMMAAFNRLNVKHVDKMDPDPKTLASTVMAAMTSFNKVAGVSGTKALIERIRRVLADRGVPRSVIETTDFAYDAGLALLEAGKASGLA